MRGVGSNTQVFAPVVFAVPVVFVTPGVLVVPVVFVSSSVFAVSVVFAVFFVFAVAAVLISLTGGAGVGDLETTCQCPGAVTVDRNVAFRSGCSNKEKPRPQ